MNLVAFRKSRRLSQQKLAEALGLSAKAKGHISKIERGQPASIKLALEIDWYSEGEVPADELVSAGDAKLLRGFAGRCVGTGRSVEPAAIGGHA